jgi:50S ribosomal protein L16 3-hydroxylase
MSGAGSMPSAPAAAPRLGNLTVRQFLRRHWQREPLLMRRAWADPVAFSVPELFALARNPEVESRLVHAPRVQAAGAGAGSAQSSGAWKLRHGPFSRLPPRRQPGWSLLVQGVDLHLAAARALMDGFRFLPDARLDDLMISFATDGGGVGPHVDSYDVFLLQVHGKRRWRIAAPAPAVLLPDAPLRILADFKAQQTWLLEPGDMLYLPPGWAHEGTAVGECMTCSIGFRAPSMSELRQAFFGFLADHEPAAAGRPDRRYRDDTREPSRRPAEIPVHMAETLGAWLRGYRPPAPLVEQFIGCYLSEPKPSVWFEASAGMALPADGKAGVALDRRTRMLYRKDAFYINGEAIGVPRADKPARALLRALADQRRLDAVQTAAALRQPWLRARLEDWLASGWLRHAGS